MLKPLFNFMGHAVCGIRRLAARRADITGAPQDPDQMYRTGAAGHSPANACPEKRNPRRVTGDAGGF